MEDKSMIRQIPEEDLEGMRRAHAPFFLQSLVFLQSL